MACDGDLQQTDVENLWNLQEKGFSAHGSYALSKIAMMAFTAKLAKRLQKQGGPTVNCLDPGTVSTKMLLAGWGDCGMPVSVSPLGPPLDPLTPPYFCCDPQSAVYLSPERKMHFAGSGLSFTDCLVCQELKPRHGIECLFWEHLQVSCVSSLCYM